MFLWITQGLSYIYTMSDCYIPIKQLQGWYGLILYAENNFNATHIGLDQWRLKIYFISLIVVLQIL